MRIFVHKKMLVYGRSNAKRVKVTFAKASF